MSTNMKIRMLRMGAKTPVYGTEGAAGADLHACLTQKVTLAPGEWAIIPTGLIFEVPKGHEVQVRPRSGMAAKFGVTVLNSPGTIDADYRGEIGVILINHGAENFIVTHGDRIAQMVLAQVEQAVFSLAGEDDMSETARGEGGFGSTGR